MSSRAEGIALSRSLSLSLFCSLAVHAEMTWKWFSCRHFCDSWKAHLRYLQHLLPFITIRHSWHPSLALPLLSIWHLPPLRHLTLVLPPLSFFVWFRSIRHFLFPACFFLSPSSFFSSPLRIRAQRLSSFLVSSCHLSSSFRFTSSGLGYLWFLWQPAYQFASSTYLITLVIVHWNEAQQKERGQVDALHSIVSCLPLFACFDLFD